MSTVTYSSPGGGAIFGPKGLDDPHRYLLWRNLERSVIDWSVAFVLLNPSTATHTEDDPTIRRCIGYARQWRYKKMSVLNIFAFRSTDPKGLKSAADPIGPENDETIITSARQHDLVVCGWGTHGTLNNRGEYVRRLIEKARPPRVLGLTKDGHPKHPLYLRADLLPVLW